MSLLAKIFIKDYKNLKNSKIRIKYGYLSSIVGVVLNTSLGILKVVVGSIFGSVAVLADGLNNVSDAGSSIVSLVGFKISNVPADEKHPFGHSRVEYVSSMIVACIVLFLSLELFISSYKKCVNPVAMESSIVMCVALAISIAVKLWLGFFNLSISKKINSLTVKGTAVDSFNDCIVTLVVLSSMLINKYCKVNLDGYAGLLVSVFVFISGIKLMKDTLSPLLGEKPSKEFTENIKNQILSYKGVLGTHDFIAHNYGPNKYFVSVHVEVDRKVDVMISHDLLDTIEQDLNSENLHLVIHMDPIVTDDPLVNKYKKMEEKIIKEIDHRLSLHDFRVVLGVSHDNLIYDLVVPFKFKISDHKLIDIITKKTKEIVPKCNLAILIDRD